MIVNHSLGTSDVIYMYIPPVALGTVLYYLFTYFSF